MFGEAKATFLSETKPSLRLPKDQGPGVEPKAKVHQLPGFIARQSCKQRHLQCAATLQKFDSCTKRVTVVHGSSLEKFEALVLLISARMRSGQ